MKKNIIFSLFSVCFVLNVTAQEMLSLKTNYVEQYKDMAIEEMRIYRIPASITLAQGIHESNIGRSRLATEANNHFGIKCHKIWTGKKIFHDDDKKGECFRKYKNVAQSYRDHSEFLTSRDRYNTLFDLDMKDYKSWARGLKKAGYATNPKYPVLLIQIIEDLALYKYDQMRDFDPIVVDSFPVADEEDKGIEEYNNDSEERRIIRNYRYGYVFLNPANYSLVAYLESGRGIFFNNKKRFIFAQKGDTFHKISIETSRKVRQLRKYNDLKDNNIRAGQMIYIEKKRNKSKTKFYEIKSQDTMYSISQKFGIKLKKLYKKNNIKFGDECESAVVLYLKNNKK